MSESTIRKRAVQKAGALDQLIHENVNDPNMNTHLLKDG